MEEISASPTARVTWLTADDRKPQERNAGSRPSKAKSTAAARTAPKSAGDHLAELAAPETQEEHQLDELA